MSRCEDCGECDDHVAPGGFIWAAELLCQDCFLARVQALQEMNESPQDEREQL